MLIVCSVRQNDVFGRWFLAPGSESSHSAPAEPVLIGSNILGLSFRNTAGDL